MKTLCQAFKEFQETQKDLEPRLCINPLTGLYMVIYKWTVKGIEERGLKVLLK